MLVEAAASAADRFFRAYYRHSTVPDEDTLFDLLNALHSLNDKLGKSAGTNLHGSAYFTVLCKLRNIFHHEAELLHEVKLIHAREIPIVTSDLAFVCLIPRSLIIQSLKDEKKPNVSEVVMATVRWYGTVADATRASSTPPSMCTKESNGLNSSFARKHTTHSTKLMRRKRFAVAVITSWRNLFSGWGDVDVVLERLFRRPRGPRN